MPRSDSVQHLRHPSVDYKKINLGKGEKWSSDLAGQFKEMSLADGASYEAT